MIRIGPFEQAVTVTTHPMTVHRVFVGLTPNRVQYEPVEGPIRLDAGDEANITIEEDGRVFLTLTRDGWTSVARFERVPE